MPQEECYLTHPELFMSGVYFYVRVCSALERYVRAGGAEMELAKALLARLHGARAAGHSEDHRMFTKLPSPSS